MIDAWKQAVVGLFSSLFFCCLIIGGMFLFIVGPPYLFLSPGLVYEYFWGINAVGAWLSIGIFWVAICLFPFLYSWLRPPLSSQPPSHPGSSS